MSELLKGLGSNAAGTVPALSKEVEALRSDLQRTGRLVRDFAKRGASEASAARRAGGRGLAQARDAAEDAMHQIGDRPILAIGAAFTLGFLCGVFAAFGTRGRSSD